ncbi:MucR family transcriptional regulator [Methylobacterium sp. J-026]|uniref:MucR family transcriptional regulator n=1 Tax=Methylobacterium sp. J-026 TaxID=2836624 RepID=UPI001FBBBB69|nr:MucR family transcriptional regulator [Methylobacterium sp. J-026]MCJ2133395.1 MucR family transcriptional regulator [Methylobacterium sp. J-026]
MDKNLRTIVAAATDYLELTADLVSAYVSRNSVRPADMAELIASTHAALTGLGNTGALAALATEKLTAGQTRKSITPDALISFIDGRPYKTLKRHLTGNGLTIEEYREHYGLPRDYPSTAASYSALAKSLGLGQQRKKVAEPTETVSNKAKRAGRPRKAKDPANS